MEFSVKSRSAAAPRTACLVLGVYENGKLPATTAAIDRTTDGYLSKIIKGGDLEGQPGQSLLLHAVPGIPCQRLLLVGAGPEGTLNDRAYGKLLGCTFSTLASSGTREAMFQLAELEVEGRDTAWKLSQTIAVGQQSLYRFDRLKTALARPVLRGVSPSLEKSRAPKRPALRRVCLLVERKELAKAKKTLAQAAATAHGVDLAQDLANLPANICTPNYLLKEARKIARGHKSVTVRALNEAAMKKLGMGALLSVAQGSRTPPQLIIIQYKGAAARQKPVALIGKGVTFDSGGISLKPGAAMDEMKFDMCGAATVLGTMAAVAEMKLPLNLVALIPATENLPDGNASKPGDVVTTLSGQTVEILNTDAEGRLILCDTLSYAARFKPELMIDVATLTGACMVALGGHPSGLFSNHPPLAAALLKAGTYSQDRAWELPLWDEYQDQLKSNFADMANIGGRHGGAITAAAFLSRFATHTHWAHLDIAGTAWKSGAKKGATGRPVPLLTRFLLEHCGVLARDGLMSRSTGRARGTLGQ